MRDWLAKMIAPRMRKTGFRFDKSYRNSESGIKFLIYNNINVVLANMEADK